MRLSDIRGERVLDVIAELVEPVASIAQDSKVRDGLTAKQTDGATAQEQLLNRIVQLVPYLLKEHKHDLLRILAALEGVTVEQYAESLTLGKLVADVTEALTDDAFTSFFGSQAQTADENVS